MKTPPVGGGGAADAARGLRFSAYTFAASQDKKAPQTGSFFINHQKSAGQIGSKAQPKYIR